MTSIRTWINTSAISTGRADQSYHRGSVPPSATMPPGLPDDPKKTNGAGTPITSAKFTSSEVQPDRPTCGITSRSSSRTSAERVRASSASRRQNAA